MAGQSNTQKQIDDVQKRLREVNTELDALQLGVAPTSDLAAEEKAALARLARKEALSRVSSALAAELAELQAKLTQEKEAERQRQIVELQKQIDNARAEAITGLWVAYDAMKSWGEIDKQMGPLKPGAMFAGRQGENFSNILADILQEMGAARVSVNAHTFNREAVPVN